MRGNKNNHTPPSKVSAIATKRSPPKEVSRTSDSNLMNDNNPNKVPCNSIGEKEPTSSSTLSSSVDDKESSSCHQGIEIKEIYHTDSPKDSSSMGSHSGNKSQGPFSTSSLIVSADEKKSSGPSSSSALSFSADDEDSSSRFSKNQSPDVHDEVKKRREKRLAKNRESARKRRKLKAELIDDLQKRVFELTKQNEELVARINVLESILNNTSSSTVFPPSTFLTSSVTKPTSDLSSASSLSSSSKSTAPPPLPTAQQKKQQKKQQLQQQLQQELTFENLQKLLIHQMYEKILSGGPDLGVVATSDVSKNQDQEEAGGNNNLLLSLFKSQENNLPAPSLPFTQQQQEEQEKNMLALATMMVVDSSWLLPSNVLSPLEEQRQQQQLQARQDVSPTIDFSSLVSSSSSSLAGSVSSGNSNFGREFPATTTEKLWVMMQSLAQQKQAAGMVGTTTAGITVPPTDDNIDKKKDDTIYHQQTMKSDLVQNFLSSSRKYLMDSKAKQTPTTTTTATATATATAPPQLNNSNEQRQPIEMIAAASLLEQASTALKRKQG